MPAEACTGPASHHMETGQTGKTVVWPIEPAHDTQLLGTA